MASKRYLKVTGWGPFRMPGERRRQEDAYKRACDMLDRVAELPQDTEDATQGDDDLLGRVAGLPSARPLIEQMRQLVGRQAGDPPQVAPVEPPAGPTGRHNTGAKFEIYTDANGEFRFRLKAGNGEIVATGEGYKTKAGVIKGVDAVKRAIEEATIDDKASI